MAKKKKKPGAVDVSSTVAENTPDTEQSPILDWMALRLLSSPKGKTTDYPQILLTKQDANSLDVLNEDDVIILVHNEGIVEKAAICSVRIVSATETPMKSPSSSGKQLSTGSCHIVSPLLLERLYSVNNGESSTTLPAVEPTTPGPENQRFSFARGGGGDILISPSKTPENLQKPQKTSAKTVWVVPLFNSLGNRIAAALCKPCASLVMKPAATIPSNAVRVVQKMASVRCMRKYVSDGETIGISFQGKALQLIVSAVSSSDDVDENNIAQLEHAIDRLGFGNEQLEDDGNNIIKAVQTAMEDPSMISRLQLLHVLPSTDISIESESNSIESALKGPFVAGLDDVINQITSAMLPALLRPESYGGLKPPKGTLLYGPSGVGKSALARQLTVDIRREHPQIDVDLIHCASLQSHAFIVGEGERMLSKLFARTRKTLLILDDIHFICPKRGNNVGVDRLAATLLALLDGVESNENIFLLGTTADPSLLDPALRRPGRLDEEVEVPIPDEKTRAIIWKFHIDNLRRENMNLDSFSDEDFDKLASLAKGFNGADCHLAIKEATRMALTKTPTQPEKITMTLLQSAIGATKPSTISSITVEVPKVYWNSIGGMVDVKQKLRDAIELPLTHADLFAKFNLPPPRGVLLYGPPGCSKTLMARALATEGKMNFLAVKGPELLSKWLGESERALASLFRRARMATPCTIFFDEIDAIASKRGGSEGNAGGERLLSQLLTELDGIGTRKQGHVIVVAATNRPDLLDHALTRPGRIDRKIYVGLPDQHSREQIFEITLKNKAHADDIDYKELASEEISGGFSGAEIVSICRDAALLAIEEDDEQMNHDDTLMIRMRHLIKAIEITPRQVTRAMLDFYAAYTNSN